MNTEKEQMITDNTTEKKFIYGELTYAIIGCLYEVHRELGCVHKEIIYERALAIEFKSRGILFSTEKSLNVMYKDKKVGIYRPDFIVDDKVILEIKSVPMLTKNMENQAYYYIKGSHYKLALIANFGTPKIGIKRLIYT